MRLKPRVDASGVLWFDNVVVTWLGWAERYYNPLPHSSLSLRKVGSIALLVLLWAITLYEWLHPAPTENLWAWLDLVLSLIVSGYAYYRRRHPFFHPSAPVRVGFSPSEFLSQAQDGRVSRRPWAGTADARVERDEIEGLRVSFVGGEGMTLRSLTPDLAIKIAWGVRLAARNALDLSVLARPTAPVRVWKRCPPGGVILGEAIPEIVLYPDGLVVFHGLRLFEFRREDVDAFEYEDSGERWLVVTAGDRRTTRIFLPQARPFLDWLTAGSPSRSLASVSDRSHAQTGSLK